MLLQSVIKHDWVICDRKRHPNDLKLMKDERGWECIMHKRSCLWYCFARRHMGIGNSLAIIHLDTDNILPMMHLANNRPCHVLMLGPFINTINHILLFMGGHQFPHNAHAYITRLVVTNIITHPFRILYTSSSVPVDVTMLYGSVVLHMKAQMLNLKHHLHWWEVIIDIKNPNLIACVLYGVVYIARDTDEQVTSSSGYGDCITAKCNKSFLKPSQDNHISCNYSEAQVSNPDICRSTR